ncbi:MAG: hypothetical protein E7311_06530 [Clostridiales bacterium]|nr:hypothetical protein [Clostridiales bacterium]
MNEKIFIILFICIIIGLGIFVGITYSNDYEETKNIERLEVRLGDKFDLIEEYNNKYILDYRQADLDKDNIVDDILLIGDKQKVSDNFANNMLVIVRNCANGKMYEYNLEGLEGYRAHIEISRLTNSEVPDILFTTDSGQKKKQKQFIILKYSKGKFEQIFDLEKDKGIELIGKYKDEYIAEIEIKNLNKTINLDLKDKKDFYQKNNVYDIKNKLVNNEVKIQSKTIDSLEQYVFEDNTNGIITTQKVIGINRTDILDEIKTVWKIDNNKLTIISIEGQRCGKIL